MSLLDLELRAIRMRIDGSDIERSLEHQHDQCIRDRAALYEEVLDLRQRLARTEELLSPRPRTNPDESTLENWD